MAKQTFIERIESLYEDARTAILDNIKRSTHKSKHSKAKVIRIDRDELKYNLDGGRYLTEISEDYIIDNLGYEYGYEMLSTEQVCALADYTDHILNPIN